MTDEAKVYAKHLKPLGFCARGTREFFSRRGWDWSDFIKNGRPAQDFEDTGDALAKKLARHARGEE